MKKNVPPRGSGHANELLKFLLVMKFAILITLFSAYQVQAGVIGQTVSVRVQQTEIKKILNTIEKNDDVRFLYNYELQSLKKKVDFAVENMPLRAALDKLFTNTGLAYKVLDNNLVVVLATDENTTENKSIRITGKVSGENGIILNGVSIIVKGTNKGTSTDNNGIYNITVDSSAVLVVSYIGYATKEVKVNGQQVINITLTISNNTLDQVVVIGYGTQKKSVVTGAISSIKASDLENMPISRIEQALQGRTSGLTIAASSGRPGAGSTVRIRGTTSINNSDPLYVVDGVPVDVGGIDYLNQADIESIEVLKDAASAAIYGTKAAAGVILVTTKKGKAGSLQVNYNGYYGTQAPAKKLDLLNATQYAALRNESSAAAGLGIVFPNLGILGTGTDWQNTIFNNNAKIQNHDISISGGNDKSTYYASFGFFQQEGIVASSISDYKRFTARFNSAHKLKRWLNFGNNFAYSYINTKGGLGENTEFGGPLSSAIALDPTTPIIVTDPAIIAANPNYQQAYGVTDPAGHLYGISSFVGQEMTNPLAYISVHQGNFNWSDNLVGNVYAEIEFIKGLKFRSSIGAKLAFWGNDNFNPLFFLSPTQKNLSSNSFYRDNETSLRWTWDNTISYTRSFGLHNFNALAGTGAQAISQNGSNSTHFNLPVNTFDGASMNYSTTLANQQGGGYESQPYALSSYFGRITYDYEGKYLFMGLMRVDGSSRFGSNNKFGKFPSVSAGWVPSKETFWPTNNVVKTLKIRASYGTTGNDNFNDFAYTSTIGGGRNYSGGNNTTAVGYSPNAPANADLKWEQTTQTDVGFDANLFKNFTLTFDWYKKTTTGILAQVTLPGYVGSTGQPWANVDNMENTGVEIELGYYKKIGQVNLDVKANASYLKNNVTWLNNVPYIVGANFQAMSINEISRTAVGHAIGSFYGYQKLGIFQTQADVNSYTNKTGALIQPNARPGDIKWADLDGDGSITSGDRTFIGDPTPKFSFGFTINASWKNFDIVLFGQGVAGNKIFQGLRRLDVGGANYQTKALGRWTGAGTSYDYPRLIDGDPNGNFSNPSGQYLEDGAYFRIKTLQIGYTINKSVLGRIGIQKARVYVGSNNLATFTKYTGYDPEIGGGSYGIDRGIYPQARSFMAGVNVTF